MSTQLKPGYKQSEVGVIPEDWEVTQVSKKEGRLWAGVNVCLTTLVICANIFE